MNSSLILFWIILFAIGLGLSIFGFKLLKKIGNCPENVKRSVQGIIVMGTSILTICMVLLLLKCDLNSSMASHVFLGIILLLGLVTMVLTSIIHNNCSASHSETPTLIILSIVTVLLSGGFLFLKTNRKKVPSSSFNF